LFSYTFQACATARRDGPDTIARAFVRPARSVTIAVRLVGARTEPRVGLPTAFVCARRDFTDPSARKVGQQY